MRIISRPLLLERVLVQAESGTIICLNGLPGSGKSTLLGEITRSLRTRVPPVRLVSVNTQSGENTRVTEKTGLLNAAKALGVGPSALIIDDADSIAGLPQALERIIREHSVTVFLAEKKAGSLSDLSGHKEALRINTITVSPLLYPEFLEIHNRRASPSELELYAEAGGLPRAALLAPGSADSLALLSMIGDSFMLKNLIERFSVRNASHIRLLLEFAASHTGAPVPAREVSAWFGERRQTISPQAVLDYLEYCAASGILLRMPVHDLDKGKDLDSGQVYYFGDTGLRTAFLGTEESGDRLQAMENLVLLRLRYDLWNVRQGRVQLKGRDRQKITFICEKENSRVYVQLSDPGSSFEERLRERTSLLCVRDAWPKILIDSLSENSTSDGIRSVTLTEVLSRGLPGV